MTKLVCVKCQTELRPSTNGVTVVEMAGFGPYMVWAADAWKCPGCGVEIVAGFGNNPIRQDHYAPDFVEWLVKELGNSPRVIYDFEKPQPKEAE